MSAGWSRAISVPYTAAIGVVINSHQDSSEFKRAFKGPVIPYDERDPFLMGSPRVKEFNGKFFMFYVGGTRWNNSSGNPEPTYKIRMAISPRLATRIFLISLMVSFSPSVGRVDITRSP